MASEILIKYGTIVKPTFAPGSNLTNGAGYASATVDNSTVRAVSALVFVRIKTGGVAPTANTPVKVYLVARSDDGTDLADDAQSSSTGTVSTEPRSAELLGSFVVPATTALTMEKSFVIRTAPKKYSFVVWNACGQTLSTTSGDYEIQVQPLTYEGQ